MSKASYQCITGENLKTVTPERPMIELSLLPTLALQLNKLTS
jgi:hypothetical protein